MPSVTITVVQPKFELLTPVEHIQEYMQLLELAGRTCYKSEEKIGPGTADKFISAIIKKKHVSVIEHCCITGRLVGSRSMSHQLVRHRISSYSQESQRYCDYGKKGLQIIIPPSLGHMAEGSYSRDSNNGFWDKSLGGMRTVMLMNSVADSYTQYIELCEQGVRPEDAREVLPNAVKTEVVTTFNLRMWRHFFEERALNPHAQWQIKLIAQQALRLFVKYLPVIFQDQGDRLENANSG